MTERGGEESYWALEEHRLGRSGLVVKLDKGFAHGVYCVYVEYGELADRIGFTAARKQALDYSDWLREQLALTEGYGVGATEDASRTAAGRRHDLECSFLSFPATSNDGCWHDAAMRDGFRMARLRADREWDQMQARREAVRRNGRRDRFRRGLDALLSGDVYAHVDAATKERLLAEVTDLAFPPRGRGL
jgi:hypothetical protein